jgi:sigma-B regulation protein RsbU (phosphoserine phosphatase)
VKVAPLPRLPGGSRRFFDAAIMRTLVDEGLEGSALVSRLNVQLAKYAPGSRFVRLFIAILDPTSGQLVYVNAGQTPPLIRRPADRCEWLRDGGVALGLFEDATYTEGRTELGTGDVLLMYSDGVTEAETDAGQAFDERGLQTLVEARRGASATELGWDTFAAVERHPRDRRLIDDLTVLVTRKLPPLPAPVVAETTAIGV